MKKKMKSSYKVRTLAIAMLLIICSTVTSVFAAPNDSVTSCTFADTSHPFAFFVSKSTSSRCINQYTETTAVNGTRLTTWSWTGSSTQWFERAIFTANGSTGSAWCVYENPNLVINCYRGSAIPEVNVATAVGNLRADIEVSFPNSGTGTFGVAPRYIHTSNMYITLGSSMSGGNYLNWTPSGNIFYQYDVGLGIFY